VFGFSVTLQLQRFAESTALSEFARRNAAEALRAALYASGFVLSE
jgi:hypothetical protein